MEAVHGQADRVRARPHLRVQSEGGGGEGREGCSSLDRILRASRIITRCRRQKRVWLGRALVRRSFKWSRGADLSYARSSRAEVQGCTREEWQRRRRRWHLARPMAAENINLGAHIRESARMHLHTKLVGACEPPCARSFGNRTKPLLVSAASVRHWHTRARPNVPSHLF